MADKNSGIYTGQILNSPSFVQAVVLASSVAQAFDVPAGMGYVNFAFNADVWAKYGSTQATIPATTSTAGTTNSELNPTARNIGSTVACTGISIISASACAGSLSWFSKS